jgi:hypothetical protein
MLLLHRWYHLLHHSWHLIHCRSYRLGYNTDFPCRLTGIEEAAPLRLTIGMRLSLFILIYRFSVGTRFTTLDTALHKWQRLYLALFPPSHGSAHTCNMSFHFGFWSLWLPCLSLRVRWVNIRAYFSRSRRGEEQASDTRRIQQGMEAWPH